MEVALGHLRAKTLFDKIMIAKMKRRNFFSISLKEVDVSSDVAQVDPEKLSISKKDLIQITRVLRLQGKGVYIL